LVDYILSCRVMGRQVEETLFYVAVQWASKHGAKLLKAKYIPTERNRPTLDVLRKAQLIEKPDNNYLWDCSNTYLRPKYVELDVPSGLLS
jgi:predicted enzyme involved in methoxymalonyl-ACP biosynthesis